MNLLNLVLFVCLVNKSLASPYSFNEELLIERLPDSYLGFEFKFTSSWERNLNDKIENYHLFSKRLADIVFKFKIQELHLTLSQGTWRNYRWGMPSISAPTGAELRIAFEPELSEKLLDEYWIQSSRTISGLFGLSINLIDNPNTVKPKFLFNNSANNVRYATIPNEIVCTENLTPWIKLLPCSNKGIAQLLKSPPKLFEAHYLQLGLHFKQACQGDCNRHKLELSQTLSLVYDTGLFKNRDEQQTVWSLMTVFTHKIQNVCPVATLSNIYLDLKTNGMSNMKPTSTMINNNKEIYLYNLKDVLSKSDDFNPMIVLKHENSGIKANELVTVHRYITEPNEIDFGIKTVITNNHNENLTVVYFDSIPWYFRLYINSLRIECSENNQIKPDKISFTPGLDRKRPHHIELAFNLKPNTAYLVYFKLEYAFLKWDEYPPDVNHGFHINPALISIKLPDSTVFPEYKSFNVFSTLFDILNTNIDSIKDRIINIYSETLLMNLPTPDFSMPYNVICLTCTALAIGFGSLHNFTTRKFIFVESKSFKEKAIDFIKKIFNKLLRR